jgi:hypothetical protein
MDVIAVDPNIVTKPKRVIFLLLPGLNIHVKGLELSDDRFGRLWG